MTFKQAVGKLHLWLGLASGLVVFVVSSTGAIFAFQDEIQDATAPWRKVEVQQQALVLPSRLLAATMAHHPGANAASAWITYFAPDRSATVFFSDDTGDTFVSHLNPYTGQLLHEQNLRYHFFTVVQDLHMHLLLPPEIGEWVVGVSTSVFVVLLGTGLVLWWPKRQQERKQRFTIKWGARWRRVNYDLHNVVGFYAASIALVLAVTGLFMVFPWMLNAAAFVANGGREYPQEQATAKVDALQAAMAPSQSLLDKLYGQVRRLSPTAEMVLLGPVGAPQEPVYCLAYQQALHYYHRDEYYFHPTSGQLLQTKPHATKSNGAKLADLNYDLHTGLILGVGGKILALVGSLISASLPVTGTLMWWGRRHKTKRRKHLVAEAA